MAQWSLKREGPVAVVSLDDGKANALTMPEFESLGAMLKEVERSDAGAVVLTGRAGYFSAGLNLKVLPTLEPHALKSLVLTFGEVVMELFMYPKPVVAAISGHALGGGAMLAMAADVRLCADGAFKFGLNEVAAGLPVPAFGVELVRSAAPSELHLQLTAHAQVLTPAEGKSMRLFESVVPAAELLPTAVTRAAKLAELANDGYTKTKRALRGAGAAAGRATMVPEVEALVGAIAARK